MGNCLLIPAIDTNRRFLSIIPRLPGYILATRQALINFINLKDDERQVNIDQKAVKSNQVSVTYTHSD